MFNWLKRRASAPASPKSPPAKRGPAATQRPPPPAAQAAPPFAASLPLPEVVGEGNTQADWSQWEDSMTTLDSQMQGLLPSARIYVRDTRPSPIEPDAFAGVRGKRKT